MSMMGEFREISEILLQRSIDKPGLVESVVLADLLADDTGTGLDALFVSMPPRQRETMRALHAAMSPEQQAVMERQAIDRAASLRGLASDVRAAAGGETVPRKQLGERLSIQKAWHGVHYLLCGTAEDAPGALGQAIMGGAPIGQERGYGPARFLTSSQVREVATALTQLTNEALLDRYDAEKMEDSQVYPGGWDDPENREWLTEAFADLAGFYTRVASKGNAVLLYLT